MSCMFFLRVIFRRLKTFYIPEAVTLKCVAISLRYASRRSEMNAFKATTSTFSGCYDTQKRLILTNNDSNIYLKTYYTTFDEENYYGNYDCRRI